MNYTKQKFGEEARQDLLKGFEMVNSAVSATAGPGGRTVALQNFSMAPKITKDGIEAPLLIYVIDIIYLLLWIPKGVIGRNIEEHIV